MTGRQPRPLHLDACVYLWRVHHRHEPGVRRCREVFSAFREGFRGAPLRVLFPETEAHGPGFPRQQGVVVDYQRPGWVVNLNRPKIARFLIEIGLRVGWRPEGPRAEFILPNGYELLRKHRAELERTLAEPFERESDERSVEDHAPRTTNIP